MSNQKMREALQAAYEAHKDDFEQPWLSLAAEALAIPADEQVGLTRGELWSAIDSHVERLQLHTYEHGLAAEGAIEIAVQIGRAAIAAHEAKRVSCSKTAKTSTREGGRVNEVEKSEQVGGAA